MTGDQADTSPFQAYVDLLQAFCGHRKQICEHIEQLLNAQRKPPEYLQDRVLLTRQFEDCFFAAGVVSESAAMLRGQLEAAHWASGFTPRQVPGLYNDLVHPAEMMIRTFFLWRQTRWPGRNARIRFAQTLFNLYLVRCLLLLSMRLWDEGQGDPGDRLGEVQSVLDQLWNDSSADQPVLVRDARWLVPMVQSPTTDDLGAYFDIAERVATGLPEADRTEIQKAHLHMLGGHLTSQTRHYMVSEGVGMDDDSVVRRTRISNALDFAMTLQDLVPLLEAYERAVQADRKEQRTELAGAILQGISPDPELFLNRTDLLGPYTMIEDVFVAIDTDGKAAYTKRGQRHIELLRRYVDRLPRVAAALLEDCPSFRPAADSYSPFGIIFGIPTNLLEDVVLKSLQRDAVTGFCIEDAFKYGDADKRAWVSGWRKLPHVTEEVQQLYDYPQQFAEDIFNRIERELSACISTGEAGAASTTGRLYVSSLDGLGSEPSNIETLPVRFVGSSDQELVSAGKAVACDPARLQRDRIEGYFLSSYQTAGGWVAVQKDLITEVLGQGRDARVEGLPSSAAAVLRLMCVDLAADT